MRNIKATVKNHQYPSILTFLLVGFFACTFFLSDVVTGNVYAAGNIDNAANEGITLYNISNFTVTNNQVYGNYEEGIDVKNGTKGGIVANNIVYDNNGPNIYADGASNVKIYSNTVYGARGATKAGIACAVESGGNAQDLFIYNNLIYGNAGGGIDCWTGHYSNVQLYNNTIYNNKRGGITATSGVLTNSVARNNIIFNNVNNTTIGTGFTADHNLFTDPSLVNAASNDYHLKAGSPAIDAGVSSGAPITDFAGAVRPVGSAIDIGAYEYGGSAKVSTAPTTGSTVTKTADINGDATINILDYNILQGCFADLLPAQNCTAAQKTKADLNNDGAVNQVDYNFFIREGGTSSGK